MAARKGKGGPRSAKRAAKKGSTRASAAKINFIPNDPHAVNGPPMRAVVPRKRTGRVANFAFQKPPRTAGLYQPGTPEFLYWQSREAALAAVEAFEAAAGPLRAWSDFATQPLPLLPDAGRDLNAYYSRDSVSFFHSVLQGGPTYSGASTDCVAHEVGHAILDALRPDFWSSSLTEHAAFHEAFGDCVAMITALEDADTRRGLLAISPDLSKANFAEAILEDLANGVRLVYGNVDGSKPRRSLNKLGWQLPSTLPASLPAGANPDMLTGEVHSFARVFTGCFYDVIRNIFTSRAARTSAALLRASRTAGKLLAEGARTAVENPRLYEAVGVAMLAADIAMHRGANEAAIIGAFANHGIALAHPARAFQARARIAGGVAKPRRGAAAVSKGAVAAEVRRRFGAAAGTVRVDDVTLGGEPASKYVHERRVSLDGLGAALAGVVAVAPEPVVVSRASATFAATLSPMPDSHTTEDEVRFFCMTLLRNGQLGGHPVVRRAPAGDVLLSATARRKRAAAATEEAPTALPTHVVESRGTERVLTRVRFACGCARSPRPSE
jgi:hypothetical protein